MAKKTRTRKRTVYLVTEGYREQYFIEYLIELYNPKNNGINLTISPKKGGSPNVIIHDALKNLHYNKVFAWFDEDKPIENSGNYRIYERLKVSWLLEQDIDQDIQSSLLQEKLNITERPPILIVSTPLSVEGIIVRLFNKTMPQFKEPYLNEKNIEYNKRVIKSAVSGIFGTLTDLDYYRQHLTKELLENKSNEINELRLLLSLFKLN